MRFDPEIVGAAADAIKKAERILIISHKNPDGDTIGSALACYEMLQNMGKTPHFFCHDVVPESFYFLPNSESVIHEFASADYDLVIMLDCAASYMSGVHESHVELFGGNFPLINIDHHPSNENFGKWNIVDIEAASTTIILTEIFEFLEWKITPKVATCLLTGLYTDTGSLKHSNASAEVHRGAAKLLMKGGRLRDIVKYVFKNTPIATLKLWGRVLKRISRTPEEITISWISDQDFADTGTSTNDLTGVVDYLNSVPDAQFSLLLTEVNGKVKGSLRTLREDVDLTEIAGKLGGGGHKKASGFTVPGKLQLDTRFHIFNENQIFDDKALANS